MIQLGATLITDRKMDRQMDDRWIDKWIYRSTDGWLEWIDRGQIERWIDDRRIAVRK